MFDEIWTFYESWNDRLSRNWIRYAVCRNLVRDPPQNQTSVEDRVCWCTIDKGVFRQELEIEEIKRVGFVSLIAEV